MVPVAKFEQLQAELAEVKAQNLELKTQNLELKTQNFEIGQLLRRSNSLNHYVKDDAMFLKCTVSVDTS